MTDFKTGHIPDPRDTSFTEDVGKVKVNEGFHIVHSIWCERANERIAELEAELAALKGRHEWTMREWERLHDTTTSHWSVADVEARWQARAEEGR